MQSLNRRRFMQAGAWMTAMAVTSGGSRSSRAQTQEGNVLNPSASIVRFHGDGLSLTPSETAALLEKLTASTDFEPDSYSRGGVVEALETRIAKLLGKERAVFMPTGTLANHLAVRTLCATRGGRVIAQADSHMVNDAGDCAQTLSGLNLIPLAAGKSCFTARDVEEILARTKSSKVTTRVGVLSIESPVRRLDNVAVPLAELKKIVAPAREAGVGLHLDGARLPLYSAHMGTDPAAVAALFDTVYVSMYKCFSAPSGAVLAGPASLLDDLYHARRMFGGGMPSVWPFAAVALHNVDEYPVSSAQTLAVAEDLFARLRADGRCAVERVPSGTNVFHIRLMKGDPADWRQKLLQHGVELPKPNLETGVFTCKMNPTWVRSTADELERTLLDSL
ncbi:MAG: aminotransferase class I/II-fold pyridoxal phosphate-dependent enzyme [Candidatus Krumholzibacteria bacterium]|nr:aminotransferase class I/II-fold pyridoxal phosphate-dependent enzyme [Candidatus Krumholzibacteria bacterium]